jgi:hypothetical protein
VRDNGRNRFEGKVADADAVATMMRSQARRGPDSCGQLMRGAPLTISRMTLVHSGETMLA